MTNNLKREQKDLVVFEEKESTYGRLNLEFMKDFNKICTYHKEHSLLAQKYTTEEDYKKCAQEILDDESIIDFVYNKIDKENYNYDDIILIITFEKMIGKNRKTKVSPQLQPYDDEMKFKTLSSKAYDLEFKKTKFCRKIKIK